MHGNSVNPLRLYTELRYGEKVTLNYHENDDSKTDCKL